MQTKDKQKTKKSETAFSKTKVGKAVAGFASSRNTKTLKDIKGKIEFGKDYNYKSMRS